MIRALRWAALTCLLAACCFAQTSEEKAAKYMESVRHQPGLLLSFLQEMPKGGNLHVHLAGAIYAESMIDWAVENNLCVEQDRSQLVSGPCDPCEGGDTGATSSPKPAVRCALQNQVLYDQLVDAWSMRSWPVEGVWSMRDKHPEMESGHDHFFASFDKFMPAFDRHYGNALAEIATRAAEDHLQYVELMHTADGFQAPVLGSKIGWDDDFAALRQKLLAGGMSEIVKATRAQLDADEAKKMALLHCGAADAQPGCQVNIHFLYQVLRGLPREQVFAQILLGFELVKADPRFVGFNLVMPEDWYVPMRDFDLHMRIIEALRKFYPGTHISLHADELALGLVTPEGLRFHIRESIERAGAERIGHGTAIMYEDDAVGLLKEMAQKRVLVEICLTSNDTILGVKGDQHPLPIYMKYGVPVALATDDEGVSRGDLTHEYLRAVETYDLTYIQLKKMARASLEHSFIAGESLWTDNAHLMGACAGEKSFVGRPSGSCGKFLQSNEKARVQWELEKAFAKFEGTF